MFIVTPTDMQTEVEAVLLSSPNAKMYSQIHSRNDFTVRVNWQAGISQDPKVLGETSGSVDFEDENRNMKQQDLRRPDRGSNLRTYIDNVGDSKVGEVTVSVFDGYYRTDPSSGQRTQHSVTRWEKLASMIHEFDLHLVPAYQRWLLAHDEVSFGQGVHPSVATFRGAGVDPHDGVEALRARIREVTGTLVSQDEHLNRTNLIDMVTTCYRYASRLTPLQGLALLRSMQNDLYTIPGLPREEALKIEELGKQRSSG